jgi:large-conductance mechanosensitive channel
VLTNNQNPGGAGPMEKGFEVNQKCEAQKESMVTLKWGVLIAFVIGFFGWITIASFSHENRITKMETKLEIHLPQITASLDELKGVTREIRDNQLRLQKKEK